MRYVLLFVLISPLLALGQNWAPPGAQWTYKQGSCCGPDTNLAVIAAVGDTLIDGQTCTKLAVEEGWFGCYAFLEFFAESNDSLFYYDPITGEFQLLFRWNALPGDTWSTAINDGFSAGDTLDWTVVDTGSVVIEGITLRTWEVQALARNFMYNAPIGFVTERLGPFGSPFTWVFSVCDGETFLQLRCYEDNVISWQDPAVAQCALSTSIHELDDANWFSVSPNPAPAGTTVQVEVPTTNGAMQLVVIDALGRELLRSDVRNERSELRLYSSGIHVVTLLRDGVLIAQQRLVVR